MTTIPVSAELVAWLNRAGMGAGTEVEDAFAPATAQREGGETRADMNSGKTGSRSPRQVGQGRNVNNRTGEGDFGEPFTGYVDDTMAKAMSRGRVYRARPLLIVLDGGLSGTHD